MEKIVINVRQKTKLETTFDLYSSVAEFSDLTANSFLLNWLARFTLTVEQKTLLHATKCHYLSDVKLILFQSQEDGDE